MIEIQNRTKEGLIFEALVHTSKIKDAQDLWELTQEAAKNPKHSMWDLIKKYYVQR